MYTDKEIIENCSKKYNVVWYFKICIIIICTITRIPMGPEKDSC